MRNKAYHVEYRKKNRDRLLKEHKDRAKRRKEQGLCTACGGDIKASPGKTLCEKHLADRRRNRKRLSAESKKKGMCSTCHARPVLAGHLSCPQCIKRGCENVRGRGEAMKRRIVDYLGGKCSRCGFVTDVLSVYEVHHRNRADKEWNLKTMRGRHTWERIKAELDKGCDLFCANCHRIVQHSHFQSWVNRNDI